MTVTRTGAARYKQRNAPVGPFRWQQQPDISRKAPATSKSQRGLTLVELMVTLAIAGIVMTMGVPSFQRAMVSNKMVTSVNHLVSTISSARSQAVTRNQLVSICKSADGFSCSTTVGWRDGWIVFTDTGTIGTVDGTDEVLLARAALDDNFTINASASFTDFFSYRASGQSTSRGQFQICNSNALVEQRILQLNATGRLRVTQGAPSC